MKKEKEMTNNQATRQFFECLYDTYEQKIFHLAYSILHQKEQAEDVTQDVFEQLYQTSSKLQSLDKEHLNYLILQIAKNKAIDLYRKNTTHIKYLEKEQQQTQPEINNNVEKNFQELITEEQFKEITHALKDPYLKVFMYRVFYDFSTKEIAHLTSTKEATVRKQFERAKDKIKTILGGADND